jgi:hypothetical protein
MASKKQEGTPQIMSTETQQPQAQPEIYLTPEMRQAIDVMIQALEIAQSKGAYTFSDASVINNAINVLAPWRLQ